MRLYIFIMLLILNNALFADAPVVENVRFEQRTDGSLLVDIYYDLSDNDSDLLDVIIEASDDDGVYFRLPCWSLAGDVGRGIPPGRDKHVVWDFYADNPNIFGNQFRIRTTAFDELSGQTIKDNLTLDRDLNGSPELPYVLKIGAPNVTLDLGGYTISGDVKNKIVTGLDVGPYEGITIKNGIIEDFLFGISLAFTDNITIENISMNALTIADFDTNVIGICAYVCEGVVIRNCRFDFLSIAHKEAVVNYYSYATIDSIAVNGCGVGVNLCPEFTPRDNGSVTNSTFTGARTGILGLYSNGVRIESNVFRECELGITTQPGYLGAVRGMIIDRNEFYDNQIGIYFTGGFESIISNNIINYNKIWGIAMMPWGAENGDVCATANRIVDNEVLYNGTDLHHHEQCIGNTWERNIYHTKDGAEIPDILRTAREVFARVDSTVLSLAIDAKLIFLTGEPIDTTGQHDKWIYVFDSENQNERYELWVSNGQVKVVETPEIVWLQPNMLSVPEQWIDSDSAVVIAEQNGGKNFRQTHDDATMGMDLVGEWTDSSKTAVQPVWKVRYMSNTSGQRFEYKVVAGPPVSFED